MTALKIIFRSFLAADDSLLNDPGINSKFSLIQSEPVSQLTNLFSSESIIIRNKSAFFARFIDNIFTLLWCNLVSFYPENLFVHLPHFDPFAWYTM